MFSHRKHVIVLIMEWHQYFYIHIHYCHVELRISKYISSFEKIGTKALWNILFSALQLKWQVHPQSCIHYFSYCCFPGSCFNIFIFLIHVFTEVRHVSIKKMNYLKITLSYMYWAIFRENKQHGGNPCSEETKKHLYIDSIGKWPIWQINT